MCASKKRLLTRDQNGSGRSCIIKPVKHAKKSKPRDEVFVPQTLRALGKTFSIGTDIGKGTYSRCYTAYTPKGKVFAVKCQFLRALPSNSNLDSETKIHEFVAIHDSIVDYYGSFSDSKNKYIVLEYCPNLSILDLVKFNRGLTEPETRFIFKPILDAVKFLHDNYIIHRDIKLANIFLDENMHPKLGDFGLAKQVGVGSPWCNGRAGTPSYMAPEVVVKPHVSSFASDIWSVGICLYTMIFDHTPFDGGTVDETYKCVTSADLRIPAEPAISDELTLLIKRILQKGVLNRMRSSDILADPWLALPAKAPEWNDESEYETVQEATAKATEEPSNSLVESRGENKSSNPFTDSSTPSRKQNWLLKSLQALI